MTNEAKRDDIRRMAFLVLLGFPFLYVFSIGPVAYSMDRGFVTERTLFTAYAPIWYACGKCEPADKALKWYLGFWYRAAR